MKLVVLDYFSEIYASSRPEITIDQLGFIENKLDSGLVEFMSRPYSREDIEAALAEMHPCKSPGPDGLPALFYKKYWSLVGDDICNVALNFLNHGHMPSELNYTYVALIPKTKNPSKMKDLRPISLCNVSYKLISKVLANRLKCILPNIVDDHQSAFVPGRLITDNVLLSSEVFHYMRHNQAKKRGFMALKLDMSKAYDRMEWDYLACVLLKMGFPAVWVDRVMKCVMTVKYSFLVNGEATEVLIPKRGLRQGDPISPYLFLLCAEGLSNLIKRAHQDNTIHGVAISRNAPMISHLFFADDSIVFSRANVREAEAILDILRRYEILSGQMVNHDKCEVSFSGNLSPEIRSRVSASLGFKEVVCHDKYLGLPTLFKRSKNISFTGIKDRIWKKLKGWKEKLLSKAGKEILIKAVAQSIPMYAMSCFKLPNSFCDDVERIIRHFWWGTSNSSRGIPWKAWKDLCRPKCEGGLGFRDLKAFNTSLLAKQMWRLYCHPNTLLARSLKARYFPSSSVWEANVGFNPSYAWRSIWSSRPTLELGVRWRVNDGKSIKMWHDNWIGGHGTGKLITPVRCLHENTTVDALLDNETHQWRRDIVSDVLFPIDADRVLQIPIGRSNEPDKRVWVGNSDGIFRVRDLYALAINSQVEGSSSSGSDPLWKLVWSLQVPPKAKIFTWRAMWDILPHGSNLSKKGIQNVQQCVRCGLFETNNHVLRECGWASNVWQQLLEVKDFPHQDVVFREWLGIFLQQNSKADLELFCVVAWQIWNARNELSFEKIYTAPELCYKKAKDILMEYRLAISTERKAKESRLNVKWVPPDPEVIKLNVDAAVNSSEDKVGLGVVARNSVGEVLVAASKTLWPLCSAERAEIEAVQWAVDLIKTHQWRKVIVEGDAKNVIHALQGKLSRCFHNQVLVDNIIADSKYVDQLSFNFCFREANFVAHRLAKWSSTGVCSFVWLDGGPSWITDIVFSDIN